MTSSNIESHIDDTVATKTSDNHTPRTEAAPAPNGPIPYPEWPAVVASLIDVFARLNVAGRPTPGGSGPITPADGSPPDLVAVTDKEAFLTCMAGCDLPAGPRVGHGFHGLLEAVMALHLRLVLQHNRQERMDRPKQGSEGGKLV